MEGKKFLCLNDINAYKKSFFLSNFVWDLVNNWSYFSKDTVGKQFARAVDSISANIAEGFGRYGKRDKIVFYRYSYGSVSECLDWNEKAKRRDLISAEEYQKIFDELSVLKKEINALIKYTDIKLAN